MTFCVPLAVLPLKVWRKSSALKQRLPTAHASTTFAAFEALVYVPKGGGQYSGMPALSRMRTCTASLGHRVLEFYGLLSNLNDRRRI